MGNATGEKRVSLGGGIVHVRVKGITCEMRKLLDIVQGHFA